MYDKIVSMICEQFDLAPEDVSAETTFTEDLGIDSLDVIELVMEMEETFGLGEIPEEDLKKLLTVGDLVDYITAHTDN